MKLKLISCVSLASSLIVSSETNIAQGPISYESIFVKKWIVTFAQNSLCFCCISQCIKLTALKEGKVSDLSNSKTWPKETLSSLTALKP